MQIRVKTVRKIVEVVFPPNIDPDKLARAAQVHYMTAWNWLKTGKVRADFIDTLKAIKYADVRKDSYDRLRRKRQS